MDASQWPLQGIVVKAAAAAAAAGQMGDSKGGAGAAIDHQKRPRPQKEKAVNCPRCNSINTKFCYYNNYSLSQPRYFCKTCRRYWTEGGTLRSVPVGGGSRKNKQLKSSSKKEHHGVNVPDLMNPIISSSSSSFPLMSNNINNSSVSALKGQDLNLGYGYNSNNLILNPNLAMAPPSSLNFSLDGFGNINNGSYGNHHVQLGIDHQEGSAKVFFPLHEDSLKLQQASTSHHHHQQQQFDQNRVHGSEPSVGYWSGMLGGSGLW